jgi:hypothetical protein
MTEDPFDRLLDAMPKISDAVNAFTSPEVQQRAFDALIAALGALPAPAQTPPLGEQTGNGKDSEEPATEAATSASSPKARGRRTRSSAKKSFTADRSIDFAPTGKPSLRDFAATKSPTSIQDRQLVAAYYLTEHLERETFDVAAILGAFKFMSWPIPSNPANALQVGASSKNWFDTGDMAAIRLTHTGTNFCEHQLPKPAK